MAAEMRFDHEFTVQVPLERVWRTVSDPAAVAAALGNGELRPVDGVQTGRVRLDPGGTLVCEATVAAVDQDDDEHVASVSVHGRQVEGPGIGSVLLRSRVREHDDATTVRLTAEALTTGHTPGERFEAGARGLFETVAAGLERLTRESPAAVALPASIARAPGPPAAAPSAPGTSLGRVRSQSRLIGAAAGLVIAAALLQRARRHRRRL